jgi:hypothetical protein
MRLAWYAGKIDDSFLTDGIAGSLDGEFYRDDKLTVLAGRLPPPASPPMFGHDADSPADQFSGPGFSGSRA